MPSCGQSVHGYEQNLGLSASLCTIRPSYAHSEHVMYSIDRLFPMFIRWFFRKQNKVFISVTTIVIHAFHIPNYNYYI